MFCISVRADKKAEIERNERVIQQQIERDEEMREMAIKIRRRFVKVQNITFLIFKI